MAEDSMLFSEMSQIGIVALLLASVAPGLILVWQIARKHRALYAVPVGMCATAALYAFLIWQVSGKVAADIEARRCYEFCGIESFLYAGMAVVATLAVSICGSIIAIRVRRRSRLNQTSIGS